MTAFQDTASVDGTITTLADARVPVMDRGFLYGDSIYEVFRTYRGVPLFFDEHWQRFENSAALIGMTIGYSAQDVFSEIRRVIAASSAEAVGRDVYVRFVVTRGEGKLDLLPSANESTRLVVIVKEVPRWNAALYDPGAHVAIVNTRRNPGEALDPNIKGGNYLNNVLAVIEASEKGADDCLMLNEAGLITEASNSNVFFVIDGRLVTPSQEAANLRGLTKAAIHQCCADDGIASSETEIPEVDAARASECFLSSATREVMPVRRLTLEDGQVVELPTGGGELTRRIMNLYRSHVDRYVAERADLRLFEFPGRL